MPYPSMGYIPRGFPIHPVYHPMHGYGAIDPACDAKYALAWGPDYDRMGKSLATLKSGELPPATPDP